MAESTAQSSPETSSQAPSQFSFSLFTNLPGELQLEILSHCRTNDLICLSLSSHALRDLTLPLTPGRPSLQSFDQALPKGEIECSCGDKTMVEVEQSAFWHRKRSHVYMYEGKDGLRNIFSPLWPLVHPCQNHSPCRAYPADHPLCRIPRCRHCACTTCPLYTRLRGWMGDRKYCHQCRKFTVRSQTKKYSGRCECRPLQDVILLYDLEDGSDL